MFAVRLVGLAARDEQRFLTLRHDNVFDKLCRVLDLRREDLSASVKMAYTTMLLDIIGHKSGRQWVKETGKNRCQ